jgi:uncharacterized protein YodC (DUF2158 family)
MRAFMMAFKIGDIVRLKSGGPAMTVTKVDDFGIRTIIKCTWFAENKNERGDFPPEALVPASPVAKKKEQ